jgi:hypothetical protein
LIARFGLALAACLVLLPAHAADAILTPPEHRRSEDQTYLTFPEWFLVYSPAEYAAFLAHEDPHRFPLLAHVGQLWSSYAAVIEATRGYTVNAEYHAMIGVIATSTTVEYGLKSLYEGTCGRLAAAVRGDRRTPEDEFAAATAQRYVDFIRDRPWYEFPFLAELRALWTGVPLSGGNTVRKLERRFAITSELLVKAAYGRLIEWGARSSFETPKPVTAVVLDQTPRPDSGAPELALLQTFGDGSALATIPRYERFTPYAQALARQGRRFDEVAGNRGVIVISVLTREANPPSWSRRVILELPYLTRPGWRRLVLEVPVDRLHLAVLGEAAGLEIEHVYDY